MLAALAAAPAGSADPFNVFPEPWADCLPSGDTMAVDRTACIELLCDTLEAGCTQAYICVKFTFDPDANPLDSYIFISQPTTWSIYGLGSDGFDGTGPGWYTFQYRATPSVVC